MCAGSIQGTKTYSPHGAVQGTCPGAADEAVVPCALLQPEAGEQPENAAGELEDVPERQPAVGADEPMGDSDAEEDEEEEAEEELSGSSRCADLDSHETEKGG